LSRGNEIGAICLISLAMLLLLPFITIEPVRTTSIVNTGSAPLIVQSDPPALIRNYSIPTLNSVPNAIIPGADNHTFWFTEFGAGKIGKFDSTTMAFNEYAVNEPSGGPASPATLAIDGQGLVWFSDEDSNSPSIWVLNSTSPQGTLQQFPTGVSPSIPIFVLVDPTTNNVWFTDYSGNYIGEITYPSHTILKYYLPTANSAPVEIARQNGTSYLWITEAAGRIARFDTTSASHSFQEYTPTVPLSYPVGIVVDKNSNVWVSEHGGSSITEFNPSNSTWRKYPTSQASASPGTGVATLAIDHLGRFWFAEHYSNRIGRLDPVTGVMDEFTLPIPGAYSLLDSIDAQGNFWFTEATANEIGTISGNATSPVDVTPVMTPYNSVTSGSSTSAEFLIANPNRTSSVTVSLNVTSSFTTNYYTTKSEVSLSTYTLTLGPGQSQNITALVTPDFSLASGVYTAGVVASQGNVLSIATFFLRVSVSPLYQLETLLPEILIAAALALTGAFLFFRRKNRSLRTTLPPANPKTPATALLIVLLVIFQEIGVVWGKCPGLPPPPGGNSGIDPYGIALDAGAIAFFAVVAYFLIRSRMRGRNSPAGGDQSQSSTTSGE
jgi:streptogramin lyase